MVSHPFVHHSGGGRAEELIRRVPGRPGGGCWTPDSGTCRSRTRTGGRCGTSRCRYRGRRRRWYVAIDVVVGRADGGGRRAEGGGRGRSNRLGRSWMIRRRNRVDRRRTRRSRGERERRVGWTGSVAPRPHTNTPARSWTVWMCGATCGCLASSCSFGLSVVRCLLYSLSPSSCNERRC